MKNKFRLILFVFIISCLSAYSQLSEGGMPPSFKFASQLRSESTSNLVVPVNLDIQKLEWEDQKAEKNGSPQRIARSIPVNVDINTTGEWTTLPDSVKIWRQTVTLSDAEGLIISYDDFFIPKGGKLFIYNRDQTQILGAYTYDTHPEGGKFATEVISGDSFTLEYVASKNYSSIQPRILTNSIGYVYNKDILLSVALLPNIDNSQTDCYVNVNCPQGKNWQNQKRGVILYVVRLFQDWYFCSGGLINNTSHDGTPYLLTAWHCFQGDPYFDSLVAYFNYEFSGCENETVMPAYRTLVGVTPLVQIPLKDGGDQFLVKLKNTIPESYTPFFNGWDRRNRAPKSGAIIHHPNGNVKKIVTYDKPAISSKYVGEKVTQIGADNAHWQVYPDGKSITANGSSGASLFDENGLVVGTLTGGNSSCLHPTYPDYYSKFWYGWDQYAQTTTVPYDQQLKTYLDPLNKGIEVLGGYDPYNKTSGIEEGITDNTKEFVIFPNPAIDELNINANSIIRKIYIYNLQGRLVFSQEGYNASTAVISISAYKKGIYTISIETDNSKLSDKFIKQ